MNQRLLPCHLILAAVFCAGLSFAHAAEKKEATAQLAASAKISQADAAKTALARVPGGTIKEGELEKEHGRLVWSFDIATPNSTDITEVQVNAITGAIESVAKESPSDQAKEKAADAKKKDKKAEADEDDDDKEQKKS